MTKRPWMPLYIDDYHGATTHLSTTEHGAYLLLLMYYWRCGSLPIADYDLRKISKLSPTQWNRTKNTIAAFFTSDWKHPRIDRELAKALEKSKVNSANAVKSHANRKASRKKVAANSQPTLHTSDYRLPPSGGEEAPPKNLYELGSEVSEDFRPLGMAMAHGEELGISTADIELEAKKFIQHYQAKGNVSNNWQASFATWLDREAAHRAKQPAKAAPRIETTMQPDWEGFAKRFAGGLGWPRGVGGEPGTQSCRCPPEALERAGIDPTTGLKLKAQA